MRILVNTTTLNRGGALQASISFILEALRADDPIEWHFAMSRETHAELLRFNPELHQRQVTVLAASPARNMTARRELRELERRIAPDVVFTFFGPAYVRFVAPHLCGVADGWVTHSGGLAFSVLSTPRKIEMLLRILHKASWYRRADAWVVEAAVAKSGLVGRYSFPEDRIFVVPNNCGGHYLHDTTWARFPEKHETIRILCFAAPFPAKNLDLIPTTAREILRMRPGLSFEFVLTLPADSDELRKIMTEAERLLVSRHIVSIGAVPVIDGPTTYRGCHMTFLPSLLETFSATYPESMAMGRPIVTTDLRFAREVCGDAAVYFKPKNPTAAAEAILKLLDNREFWEMQVGSGRQAVRRFPDPRQKYERYRDVISAVAGAVSA